MDECTDYRRCANASIPSTYAVAYIYYNDTWILGSYSAHEAHYCLQHDTPTESSGIEATNSKSGKFWRRFILKVLSNILSRQRDW